jgi:ribonuclease P protein component
MGRAPAEPVVGRAPAEHPVASPPAQEFLPGAAPTGSGAQASVASDSGIPGTTNVRPEAGAIVAKPRSPGSSSAKRPERVRRHGEYRAIQTRGRRVHGVHYVWIVMPRPASPVHVAPRDAPFVVAHDGPRLGFTMTRKAMPRAVDRNRARRVLREVFRLESSLFPRACDIVAIGRPGAEKLSYAEVLAEVRAIAPKLAAAARGSAPRTDPRRG